MSRKRKEDDKVVIVGRRANDYYTDTRKLDFLYRKLENLEVTITESE